MLLRGVMHKFGSLEESLALWAMNRENEVEYLKILCIISAIMGVGNNLAAVLSGSASPSGSDNLTKLLDSLQSMMMPHRKEEMEKKVEKYQEIMREEHLRGELKFHVVESGRPKHRKKRITKVR